MVTWAGHREKLEGSGGARTQDQRVQDPECARRRLWPETIVASDSEKTLRFLPIGPPREDSAPRHINVH
jgi:hypothetical protein